MIGIDPHKGSHTAVAIDAAEAQLGSLRVRASAAQASKLVEWAAPWPVRIWAVEGAGGLGHLLAQQLLAAGERVLDVQPKLGSRVRLLSSASQARTTRTTPGRSPSRRCGHRCGRSSRPMITPPVLKMWSKRHRDLSRLRCQAACRLHAVLREIVPGGVPKAITAAAATALLDSTTPAGPVAAARHQLAAEHAADLRQLDDKLRDTRRKISAAVRAGGSTLTGLFGVGPVITATVLGDVADIARFPSRDHFAA